MPEGPAQQDILFRAILESPRDIVIFALDREYRYLAFNRNHARTMAAIWNVDIEVGQCMLDVIARPDDRAKAKRNFDRALAGEHFTLIEAYGAEELDRRYYEDAYSPIEHHGDVIGLTVYLTDITEVRKTEQALELYRQKLEDLVDQRTAELETANEQLRREIAERKAAVEERRRLEAQVLHAQKLESLGVLAGGIAHDFNNLLVGVLGSVDLARLDMGDPEALAHHLEVVKTAALRASELTNQMLAYSGKAHVEFAVLDVNDLIVEMGALLGASVSKRAHLVYELDEVLPPVRGDASQLRQVVMNLLTNASEAIEGATGMVRVVTRSAVLPAARPATAPWHDGPLPAGEYVVLEVCDDGVGMAADTRLRLFDPFFTTKFTGRGLGLAAVLGIVRGHDGAVEVESEPGVGTTFRVLLPVTDPHEVDDDPTGPPVPIRGDEPMVLVCDDEPEVRAVAAEMLRRSGFVVLEAATGEAAVAVMSASEGRVDAVLLDLTLPGLSGAALVRALRAVRDDVRVVLFSGYDEAFTTGALEGSEIAGFVHKPFRMKTLVETMKGALDL